MIRGAIEVATESIVSGWIHSTAVNLRNELILAFCGPHCIGAGTVEYFRQDLLDAGLGDGCCGFQIAIALPPGEFPGSVVVRLANSDAALIQSGSKVVPA